MERLQHIWQWIREHPTASILTLAAITCFFGTPDLIWAVILVLGVIAWMVYRHPIWAIPVFTAVMLLTREFYPFSDFPMYSDPDESENYLYVAEVVDPSTDPPTLKALPIETLTRTTAPKVKKMFKSRYKQLAKELGISERDLTDEQLAQVGKDLVAYLRTRDDDEKAPLPDALALVDVWILYDGAHGFSETPRVVVYDPPLNQLTTTP